MNQNEFIEEVKKLKIDLDNEKLAKLTKYYYKLIEYNQNVNLTSIINKEDFYLKHFYDSLTIKRVIDVNKVNTLLDIGSGAGFPGIVLKIIYPNIKITLLDSNHKKTDFLNYIVKELALKDVKIINKRCEEYILDIDNYYDIVVARAVTNLRVLLEIGLPFVKINGSFIAMKGNAEDEIQESLRTIKIMDCDIDKIDKFILPNNDKRTLIKIKKNKKTNIGKMRSYDKIIKTSL